jgi:hypothetical protein
MWYQKLDATVTEAYTMITMKILCRCYSENSTLCALIDSHKQKLFAIELFWYLVIIIAIVFFIPTYWINLQLMFDGFFSNDNKISFCLYYWVLSTCFIHFYLINLSCQITTPFSKTICHISALTVSTKCSIGKPINIFAIFIELNAGKRNVSKHIHVWIFVDGNRSFLHCF